MAEKEELPEELRCKRTDGKQWRCTRRVAEDKKLCEIHYLQGRHRQQRIKVPDSLKLERKTPNKNPTKKQESLAPIQDSRAKGTRKSPNPPQKSKKRKRKARTIDVSEALDEALKKMKLKRGDLQLELIREFLKRQVEKKKERQLKRESQGDLLRELPYGVMAISQPTSSPQRMHNVGGGVSCNVKVGVSCGGSVSDSLTRCFRSKNIEPLPFCTKQVLPCAGNVVKKRKKCHWCRKSSYRILIKCSSCRKQFFCVDCIQERYFDKQEVKRECPVCRGTCSCRTCSAIQSKDIVNKEIFRDKKKVDRIQLLLYLIDMLLPLLEQINQEKSIELEVEAKIKGMEDTELHIQLADVDHKKLHCCYCKTSIVDFHRSCSNCSYGLCLSCCQEFRQGLLHKGYIRRIELMSHDRRKASPKWKALDDDSINCPPKSYGGCGENILELKCQSPFGWTQQLEASAKDTVCNYGSPKPSDAPCSLCTGKDKNDDVLFFPSRQDLQDESVQHFQKHWGKGHPLILRNLLQSTSDLSWDPIILFSTYLELIAKSKNDKEAIKETKCLDWCEVEIGMKQIFMGSLEGKTHANVCHETVKFKVWLSSGLFQQQFSDHYDEIMRTLPIQEYVNPLSGLLNLAVKLPHEIAKPELGPCIYISYGGSEEIMQPDFLTNICYDSYDVVNILAHTTDLSITEEQLNNIKILMNKYREPSQNTTNQKSTEEVNGKSSLHSEDTQESSLLDGEGSHSLPNGVAKLSVFSGDSQENFPEFDSEASVLCSDGTDQSCEDTDYEDDVGSSGCAQKLVADSICGAQWDIFHREDVPKLVEYLKKYSNEFNLAYGCPKKVVHPILDQRYFLDAIHKLRLKEEFNVEPWTIEQHLGEAIIIPAGCPYQIRRLKSCVNVVLRFISPESASECFKLTDELRLLPANHKAKEKILEVKRMSLHSINAAIDEIHSLSHAESGLGMILSSTKA